MRPPILPTELWREVQRSERLPARPQPVLELPLPVRRAPVQERCEDDGRGVVIIDVWGND